MTSQPQHSAWPPTSEDPQPNREPTAAVAPLTPSLAEATAGPAPRGIDGLGFVMDVPVRLTVELGRKRVRIGDVLKLGPGSVLELDKANGDPLDVLVNDRLVARAEAVVVGERYGVRVTEVLVSDEGHPGERS